MVKKLVGGVLALVVLGAIFVGPTKFFGWGRTASDQIEQAIDDAVSVKFKVADAERMVKELDPEISRVMKLCAGQEYDVEKSRADVAKKDQELSKAKTQMLALNTQLKKNEKEYVFEGRSYTQEEIRRDLEGKVNRFKRDQASLDKDKALLKAREDAWHTNTRTLEKMVSTRKDLESQIEFLKNRVEVAEATEALGKSEIVDSNSKMGRAEKLIAELNKKLDVDEKVRALEERQKGEIVVPETESPRDVSKEVEDLFGDEAKSKTEL